jgi:hypothetical protein
MTQNYELVVKGARNYEDKVAVTVALQDKERFDGEIFDMVITMDRVEGAALEFYEAAARMSVRQVFLGVAEKLSEKVESYLQHQYSIKIENSANKHDRPHLAGFDSAVKANTRRAGREKNAGDDISRAIVAAMRAVNERQRHHENGVAFVAKAVQQTIDGMTTKLLQELKLSQQE